jgi:hypothetical protein
MSLIYIFCLTYKRFPEHSVLNCLYVMYFGQSIQLHITGVIVALCVSISLIIRVVKQKVTVFELHS